MSLGVWLGDQWGVACDTWGCGLMNLWVWLVMSAIVFMYYRSLMRCSVQISTARFYCVITEDQRKIFRLVVDLKVETSDVRIFEISNRIE